MLTNPYYKGDVRFRGGVYPGRHQALIDPATWQRVQDVLASHVVGEKVRLHHHYLKSTVYCGGCGNRLVVHMAKNRHGVTYEYFICSGRHSKTNDCVRQAMSIPLIENKIVNYYKTLALTPALRRDIQRHLREQLEASITETRQIQHELLREQTRLQDRSRKLLDGHLSGIIPSSLYAEEQEAVSRQLATIEERRQAATVRFADIDRNLDLAMELLENCYEAYLRAPDDIRRRFNQALFEKVFIEEDGEPRGELAEPFGVILGGRVGVRAPGSEEPRDPILRAQGSQERHLVRPEGFEPPTY